MNRFSLKISCTLIFLWGSIAAFSQDIEAVAKAKPVKVSGGVNFSTSYYDIVGAPDRQPPFYWTASANLNFTFFDLVSAPFSFTYSPQGKDLSYPYRQLQPFNQMGISPSYKGVTAHLGYRSMNFSPYTYSGNNFLGVGTEINRSKKKVDYAFMFGRLTKAIKDTLQLANTGQTDVGGYTRYGAAAKVKYREEKGASTEVVLFKAWDDEYSLNVPVEYVDTPKDNFIISINSKRKLTKNWSFNLEYALSAITRNINAPKENGLSDFSFVNNLDPVFNYTSTSSMSGALKADMSYNMKIAQLKVGYRRIGPDYESLGIPFINNDIQDITAGISWRMFSNKISMSTSGGMQQNNLDGTKNAENRRLIGSVNTIYNITQKWNVFANVSNFNTSVNKTRIDGLDSLNYYQVTNNITVGTNYRIAATENATHAVMFNGSYQDVSDVMNNNSLMYTANGGYTNTFPKLGLSSSIMANYNANSFQGLENPGYGPSATLSKSLLNKTLKVTLSANQLRFTNSGKIVDNTTNIRMGLTYTFKKKHNTSLNCNYIRKENIPSDLDFKEYRVTLQYGYNFSLNK